MRQPPRSGILDMFVLYINDRVADGRESDKLRTANTLVILTCQTYLVFDDRSEGERSRVTVDKVVKRLTEAAYRDCNDLIDRLLESGRKDKLEILYSRLTDNQCRSRLEKILNNKETEIDTGTKITI